MYLKHAVLKMQIDVSLNIASDYDHILFAHELIDIAHS